MAYGQNEQVSLHTCLPHVSCVELHVTLKCLYVLISHLIKSYEIKLTFILSLGINRKEVLIRLLTYYLQLPYSTI
jgi:hypothetical protein